MKSQCSSVNVTRNGKPIVVVMSNVEYQKLKLQVLRAALIEGEGCDDTGKLDIEDTKQKSRLRAGLSVNVNDTYAGEG